MTRERITHVSRALREYRAPISVRGIAELICTLGGPAYPLDSVCEVLFAMHGLDLATHHGSGWWSLADTLPTQYRSRRKRIDAVHAAVSSAEPVYFGGPSCPDCDREMLLRTALKGLNPGNQFWGCPSFPVCDATLPLKGGPPDTWREYGTPPSGAVPPEHDTTEVSGESTDSPLTGIPADEWTPPQDPRNHQRVPRGVELPGHGPDSRILLHDSRGQHEGFPPVDPRNWGWESAARCGADGAATWEAALSEWEIELHGSRHAVLDRELDAFLCAHRDALRLACRIVGRRNLRPEHHSGLDSHMLEFWSLFAELVDDAEQVATTAFPLEYLFPGMPESSRSIEVLLQIGGEWFVVQLADYDERGQATHAPDSRLEDRLQLLGIGLHRLTADRRVIEEFVSQLPLPSPQSFETDPAQIAHAIATGLHQALCEGVLDPSAHSWTISVDYTNPVPVVERLLERSLAAAATRFRQLLAKADGAAPPPGSIATGVNLHGPEKLAPGSTLRMVFDAVPDGCAPRAGHFYYREFPTTFCTRDRRDC